MMDSIFYFAYSKHIDAGNLKRLCIHPSFSISAFLPNYRLAFNVLEDELFRFETRGLANIVPRSGFNVEGVLYELSEEDFIKLDDDYGVPEMKYYRKLVTAQDCNGCLYSAMTYAGWPDVTSQGLLPSGNYMKEIIDAARHKGMSSELRQFLETHPTTV
jgi:AIG2 family protein